jgi:hypothetical protein
MRKGSSAMKEAFSGQHSAFSQSQNQQQKQKRFTTEDTESTERGKTTIERRAEAILKRIGEACDELERLAEDNPELVGRVTVGAEEHKESYLRLKARLALADSAPRCRWVHQDGTTCGSPQMKRHIYCFAHMQMAEAQALALRLPAMEDANAIMIGIMRIQKALIDGTISTKTAGLLLYSMQLALQAVGKTTFGQVKGQELVRETVDEEIALSEKQTPTMETRRHGEKTLLMNADDADQNRDLLQADGRGLKPVEWKPTPDMYRRDTPEGREAYEASLRVKIEPRVGTEGTQPRAAGHPNKPTSGLPGTPAVPQEHRIAETYANLG